jgi:hypothetical protein
MGYIWRPSKYLAGGAKEQKMPIRLAPRVSRLLPLAAALLWAGAVPAAAQQTDEPTVLQQMLGKMGILDIPEGPGIDYRERAPLVVPPSSELVAPRGLDDIRKINPDWPTDPDIERQRAAAGDKRTVEEQRGAFYSGARLTPDEIRRGTVKRKTQSEYDTAGEELSASKDRYSPTQLGFKGWSNKDPEKSEIFAGEPERRSLTEPPTGYRTPSSNAPYGVIDTKREEYKPPTLYDRTGSAEDKKR